MSKEVKRYELRIVDRYAGDGTGDIETDARMKQEAKGRYVLFSDYEDLLAERDAAQKDAERYRRMRAVVIAEREGCTEELYDNECDRLLEAYDAALQGDQP
ncbi:hypothetical protein [Stutzerimonas nitrititolerans]|uniref:hypothetical protein n=1 Tax=Stutzerimonas nitrititolerans TaxID=2482751 RepID=UPI0028AD4626|nr:hypothetical protein [Stutzerimonas nitrititolerans]